MVKTSISNAKKLILDMIGLPADSFQTLDIPDCELKFSIKSDELKSDLQSVLFACNPNNIKPILSGVLFEGAGSLNSNYFM